MWFSLVFLLITSLGGMLFAMVLAGQEKVNLWRHVFIALAVIVAIVALQGLHIVRYHADHPRREAAAAELAARQDAARKEAPASSTGATRKPPVYVCKPGDLYNEKLLVLASKYSFLYDSSTGTNLLSEVPSKVEGLGAPSGMKAVSTSGVITQKIPTKHLAHKDLQGGAFWFWCVPIIGGIVIGFLIAGIPGAFVGLIAAVVIVGAVFKFEQNDFTLHIDNTLDYPVAVKIEDYRQIEIGAKSQIPIGLEFGRHHIVIWDSEDNRVMDRFVLDTADFKREEDMDYCFIYNVNATNRYSFAVQSYGQIN
jgi:hypothetical protein